MIQNNVREGGGRWGEWAEATNERTVHDQSGHHDINQKETSGGRWGVQTSDQYLAVIRASHALMAAGDNEAALILLAAFASPGVDAQC